MTTIFSTCFTSTGRLRPVLLYQYLLTTGTVVYLLVLHAFFFFSRLPLLFWSFELQNVHIRGQTHRRQKASPNSLWFEFCRRSLVAGRRKITCTMAGAVLHSVKFSLRGRLLGGCHQTSLRRQRHFSVKALSWCEPTDSPVRRGRPPPVKREQKVKNDLSAQERFLVFSHVLLTEIVLSTSRKQMTMRKNSIPSKPLLSSQQCPRIE
jgi:hypothetical protein